MKEAIAIYLGQATGAAIAGCFLGDQFYMRLAIFSVGASIANIAFILIQSVIRRAS